MVPFNFKPAVANPDLEDELMQEAPRILQWMVDGCLKWQGDRLPMPAAKIKSVGFFIDCTVL